VPGFGPSPEGRHVALLSAGRAIRSGRAAGSDDRYSIPAAIAPPGHPLHIISDGLSGHPSSPTGPARLLAGIVRPVGRIPPPADFREDLATLKERLQILNMRPVPLKGIRDVAGGLGAGHTIVQTGLSAESSILRCCDRAESDIARGPLIVRPDRDAIQRQVSLRRSPPMAAILKETGSPDALLRRQSSRLQEGQGPLLELPGLLFRGARPRAFEARPGRAESLPGFEPFR
jgi:hypothetical protein